MSLANHLINLAQDKLNPALYPRIARWTVPDPMAEKYYGISGYVYCANNPMRYIDPDGRDWRDLIRGISNAFIDDLNPNPIAPTISSSSSASNESHYNIGQVIGHVAAGLVGAAATIDGGKNMVAGAAIAVAGSATVVLIPTGRAVAAGGALEAGYGIMTMSKAAKNIGTVGSVQKKGPKNLVEEAKESQTKKEVAKQRQINREKQTQRGNSREGLSNQGTRGSHASRTGGKKGGKHDKAEERRSREQRKADERKNK